MLLKTLENTLNHVLETDPLAMQGMAALAGNSVVLEIKGGVSRKIVMSITARGVKLYQDAGNPPGNTPGCTLRGSPVALLRYLTAGHVNPSSNTSLGIEIEGDLQFANRLSRVLSAMDIDWKQILSQLTGDYPARHIVGLLQSLATGFEKSRRSAAENLKYIVRERQDLVVSAQEAEVFYQQVDQLFARTQMLERRISQLSRER